MRHWLFKTEPDAFSFERLQREGRTEWSGVRNYQARNNMTEMKLGDLGFYYHSSIKQPAIVGICRVVREAYPDFTAFDRQSEYYDPKSNPTRPLWKMVDVEFVRPLAREVTLAELREQPAIATMKLLRKGSRLSVQPVTPQEWDYIIALSERPA